MNYILLCLQMFVVNMVILLKVSLMLLVILLSISIWLIMVFLITIRLRSLWNMYSLKKKRLKRLSQIGLRNSILNPPKRDWKFFCNHQFYYDCKSLPLRMKRKFCHWLPNNRIWLDFQESAQ